MFIVLIGPPGAGKGTQARKIIEKLQVVHLSTGDMLREAKRNGTELGKLAAGYMDQGALVPDEVVVDVVTERLSEPDCRNGCLLDGFPRTLPQAESLDDFLAQRGEKLDVVLELQCDEAELSRRLLERAKLEGRADDTPDTIANRHRTYREQTTPLLAYYNERGVLRSVNGIQTREEVFAALWRTIEAIRG